MNRFSAWLSFNKLSLNIGKTSYVVFRPYQKIIDYSDKSLMFSGQLLNRATSVKFLGIILHENLRWDEHVNFVRSRIASGLFALSCLRSLLPVNCLLSVYYALIHSHITYALEVYGLTYSSTLHPLLLAQKRALRVILLLPPRESVTFAFRALSVPSIHVLIKYKIALLFYKLIHGMIPACNVTIHHFHTPYSLRYQTAVLQPLQPRTNFGIFTLAYFGSNVWNSLPLSLRLLSSFISFKSQVRSLLLL